MVPSKQKKASTRSRSTTRSKRVDVEQQVRLEPQEPSQRRSLTSTQEKRENYFNCNINNYEESLIYAKKMIAMALSSIAYLRALWPEDFFVTRYFENVEFKIIEAKSHPQARVLTEWILGVFHALERKYLRQFTFSIHLDAENPDDVLETYEFNVAYNDQVDLEISSFRERKEKIRPNSIRFIRNLMYASNMLKDLPDKGYMNLRLTYYDDVTPDDYEPPGFRASKLTELNFAQGGGRVELPVGRLHSLWHVIEFSVNACKNLMRDYDEYEKAGESVIQERTSIGDNSSEQTASELVTAPTKTTTAKWMQVNLKRARRLSSASDPSGKSIDQSILSSMDDSFSMNNAATGTNIVRQSAATATELTMVKEEEVQTSFPPCSSDIDESVLLTKNLNKMSLKSESGLHETTINEKSTKKAKVRIVSPPPRIKCDCGLNDDNSNMDVITCVSCNKVQHAVCYRILMPNNKANAARAWLAQYKHYCRGCFSQMEEPRPSQIDRSIYKTKEEQVKELCVLRRVTYWIWQRSTNNSDVNNEIAFTAQSIAHDIGLSAPLVRYNLNCIATQIKMTKKRSYGGGYAVYRIDAIDLAKLVADWFTQPLSLLNKTYSPDNFIDTSFNADLTTSNKMNNTFDQSRNSIKANQENDKTTTVDEVDDEMAKLGQETKKMKIANMEAKVRMYKKASRTLIKARNSIN